MDGATTTTGRAGRAAPHVDDHPFSLTYPHSGPDHDEAKLLDARQRVQDLLERHASDLGLVRRLGTDKMHRERRAI